MNDGVKALLAEADGWRTSDAVSQHAVSALDTIRRLRDALEAAQRREAFETLRRIDEQLEAAQVPATDDEREALKTALTDGYWQRTGYRVTWEHVGPLMDAILAAGFRRSSRVPVSRDELAGEIEVMHEDSWDDAYEYAQASEDIATGLSAKYDIYPKADRKSADSSNGDD